MGLVTVLRPDVPDSPVRQVRLAPRREIAQRPVIGLVANGKPLATELLAMLADELHKRLGREIDHVWLEKPQAGSTISSVEADGMAARAHMIVTGLGD
jgi:hypothetical protein